MKNQALFFLEDKSKKLQCHLLQFLFGSLRVKNDKNNMEVSIHIMGTGKTPNGTYGNEIGLYMINLI